MSNARNIASGAKFVDTAGDTMTGRLTISGATVNYASSPILQFNTTGTNTDNRNWAVGPADDSYGNFHIFRSQSQSDSDAVDSAGRTLTITKDGYVKKPNQPSFAAVSLSSSASGQDCVFPNVRYNVGSHYSSSTGRFTCPVAGTYLFGWTNIAAQANDVYRYYIRVNGGTNISGTQNDTHLRIDTGATGSEYGTNGMFTWPVQLNANDYVNIYYYSDGGSLTYTASDYPQFWGYLVG